MNRPIRFLLPVAFALSLTLAGSALADELVITLKNGRTIVLDTAEIRSMTFQPGAEPVPLIPSPKRLQRGLPRPPGFASATLRASRGPKGNALLTVSMTGALPNRPYDIYLFLNGARRPGVPICLPATDATGCLHHSQPVRLPSGENTVTFVINAHKSDADLYVSPGHYEQRGISLRVP